MVTLTKKHIGIGGASLVIVVATTALLAFGHLVSAAPLGRHGAEITPLTTTSHTTAQGFDICQAPPLGTMATWWAKSPYRWINIYMGGLNRACPDGPSADWVASVYGMGWGIVPTYVGYQAPANCQPGGGTGRGMYLDPIVAHFQGQTAATDAVASAKNIGLDEGTIIYYDMEYYYQPGQMDLCNAAVDAFIGGWDQQLQDAGYKAGVYIAGTNVEALQRADVQEPDAVWLVNSGFNSPAGGYSPTCTVYGNTHLPDGAWHGHRLYQYLVNGGAHLDHSETWGGVTMTIDSDCADGDIVGHDAPIKLAPSFSYIGQNADGRLVAFARGPDDTMWATTQTTPNGLWSTWATLAATPTFAGDPHVAQLLDGRLAVIALGSDGDLWWSAEAAPNGTFGAWQPVAQGTPFTGTPALGRNAEGSLALFALGKDGNIWTATLPATASTWTAPQPLQAGQHFLAAPSVAQDADGRLEVFALGKDHTIWVNFQQEANGTWFGWLPLHQSAPAATKPAATPTTTTTPVASPPAFAGIPTTVRLGDGRLEVFARGSDGSLWQDAQKTEGGSWTGWASIPLPTPGAGDPMVALNANGLLSMLVLGTDGNIWQSQQAGANNTWLPWATLEDGVTFTGTPGLAKGADGRLVAFALGGDGDIWAAQQQTPGGTWSTWAHLEDGFTFQQ